MAGVEDRGVEVAAMREGKGVMGAAGGALLAWASVNLGADMVLVDELEGRLLLPGAVSVLGLLGVDDVKAADFGKAAPDPPC